MACSNKILRLGSKAPKGVVNQRKTYFSLDFILLDIGLSFNNLLPFYLALVPKTLGIHIKGRVETRWFHTKNQMVFVKETHCKMLLCFDMVGHRRVVKGYRYQVSNAYS